MTAWPTVVDLLTAGPHTQRDLLQITGVSSGTLRKIIYALRHSGRLRTSVMTMVGRGRWVKLYWVEP